MSLFCDYVIFTTPSVGI